MIDFESKTKWQLRIVTIVLFSLGFVAGMLALTAYNQWHNTAKQPTKHERYQDAFDSLNLDEKQKIEVQQAVTEIRENIQQLRRESEPRMQEIRARNDARLQKILTLEQWTRFQEMRESIRKTEE